jgi:acyl-CoA reductase-like NAD-dependent aldehyde dehydrogenase
MFKNPTVDKFIQQPVIPNFINGKWQTARAKGVQDVRNPSDGTVLARVASGKAEDIDDAVRAAHSAFPGWARTSPKDRAALLTKLADAIDAQTPDLALMESLDVGKAISAAEAFDIPFGASCLRYYADLIQKISPNTALSLKTMDARVHRTPYGVCGFIFPWNFPFDLLLWGIAPALAAGNTVVVKPSEITPLTTLYFCQLAQEVGFPPGVINVVSGLGTETGPTLTSHPLVRRMSFTGSPTVGKIVAEACGRNLIPCKLELGGKGAAIVFDDVDVADAAQKLAGAITLNTGQVCCTASRWIVQDAIFDTFVEQAIAALKKVKIGPGPERDTQMGPLASETHRERVLKHLDRGLSGGAKSLLSSSKPKLSGHEGGYYISPSLLTGDPDNACCREEIFGPSAYLLRFKKEQEAIDLVNRLDYGLANSVWSQDLKRANHIAEDLVVGNVWINAHNVFAYGLPYGGVNLSGLGGGVNSPETLNDYLRPMTIARPLPV